MELGHHMTEILAREQGLSRSCTRCGFQFTMRPDEESDRYCIWCGAVDYRPRTGVREHGTIRPRSEG